ncbi:MAG: DNA polymerase III subunit alpha [Actinomycetota bacterium]
MSFTHLNVSSAYSFHFGTTKPDALAAAAAAMGFTALAITDRDGLYGAVKHIAACLENNLSPIVGVRLEVAGLGLVTVFARTGRAGWAALCKVVSKAQQRGKKKVAISPKDLADLVMLDSRPNCLVLLGPESDFGQATLQNATLAAQKLLAWQKLLPLPGTLAVEVVTHLTEPGTEFSTIQAKRMLQLATTAQLSSVLTNAVRYLTPDDALTADVLDAARYLEPLGLFKPQPNAQAWLKPQFAMEQLALEITESKPAALALLNSTEAVAASLRLDPVADCDWARPKTPEKSALGIDGNPFEVLWQKAHSGLNYRYPNFSEDKLIPVRHRLHQELITINKLGFATYFLTVADVAQMIRDMRIRTAARGSGAGSLVNYLLGISGVDPIEHDLLFERFLSTERSSLPDIDIDVESARRHDIYRAIFKRYGGSRVTLLSMQSTYRGRGAVRDSGMALGFEDDQIDEIAKSIWRFSARNFRGALGKKPELKKIAEAIEHDRKLNLLVDITERLDRLPRHISLHPCGVILGNQDLLSLTPVEPSGLGLPMSQFDKDDMDPMGMLKLDILGVRMQSAMAYAVREIDRVSGKEIDLDGIPRDDSETFKQIRSTNTLGMFQIESPGQRELTGKHQPTEFNDLTIQISLFRPGPMKGNMIVPYLDGRHGFAKPDLIHPDLIPILKSTHGVVIFHEQVLKILNVMTGCSLARADELRRSLEKDPKQVERLFRESALKRGYSGTVVGRIWSVLEGFGSFGFCKAHGAAFALPTYQSAWLKTHYPTEFLAGLFTHDPGMYPKRLLLAEARRLGVKLLPVDVNFSRDEYLVEKTSDGIAIRMSLCDLHGISEAEIARIIQHQPYLDLPDFYLRAAPSRATAKRLALIGALDSLGRAGGEFTRGDISERIRQLTALKTKPKVDQNQPMLDFTIRDTMPTGNRQPKKAEIVQTEMNLLGLDVTDHALAKYQPMLDAMGVVRANELLSLRSKTEVLVAGIRVATQSPPMRSGKRVVFITLDDGSGCSDATFFDEAQARSSSILFNTKYILISGKTRRTGVKGVSIMAENAWDLKGLWSQYAKENLIAVEDS